MATQGPTDRIRRKIRSSMATTYSSRRCFRAQSARYVTTGRTYGRAPMLTQTLRVRIDAKRSLLVRGRGRAIILRVSCGIFFGSPLPPGPRRARTASRLPDGPGRWRASAARGGRSRGRDARVPVARRRRRGTSSPPP